MEAKLNQNAQKERLEDLPESKNEFWGDAEIHTNIAKNTQADVEKLTRDNLDKHWFIRISGHQAYCNHCNWGFQLDPGDKIKDGHLYDKEGKFVI